MSRPTMAGAALLMGAAVLGSRLLGYVRDAYIAFAFGAGPETDAYVAAFTLPDYLSYALAGGALSITFVPLYTGFLEKGRRVDGVRVLHVVLSVMGVVVLVGLAALWVLAPRFVPLIVPEFGPEQMALCVRLTRILLPAQVFFYLGGIIMATLLARKRFLAPALAPLIYNLGIIVGGVALGSVVGVEGLALGAVAGAIAGPFLVPVIAAWRLMRREGDSLFRFRFAPRDPFFREWLLLTIPLMIGFSLTSVDEWVMRFFASGADGDIFRINLSRRLLLVPVAVVGQAAGAASLPFFSSLFAAGKREELLASVRRALKAVWLVGALAGAGLVAVAYPAVDLLYRRGDFGVADARQTAAILTVLAVGVPLWCAQALLARAFYAVKDTWTPMLAGTLVTALTLPLFWLGWNGWGAPGLAAAAGIGMLLHATSLATLLPRRLPGGVVRALAGPAARALALGVVAGGVAWCAEYGVSFLVAPGRLRAVAQLVAAGVTFVIVAVPGARWLGFDELDSFIDKVLAKLGRTKGAAGAR